MKGFARVFESIIASLIIIASMTFFFTGGVEEARWDDTLLQATSQDALQSLYKSGHLSRLIESPDEATKLEIYTNISLILPATVDFSLSVRGLPNGLVKIVCVDCPATGTDSVEQLSTMLNATYDISDVYYKNRLVSMRIKNISMATESIESDTNVLLFFDKTKINTYSSKIDKFLGTGGTVFLLSDLSQSDVTGNIARIFNLTWASSNSAAGNFYSLYDSKNISHFMARYYANITGRNLENVGSENFAFHANGISIRNDGRDVIVTSSGAPVAYIRGDYEINATKGRSVWFADYTRTDPIVNNLLKSALMWASGEKYTTDITKKTPAPINFKSSILVYDGDVYIVELTIWRAFF